MVKPGRWKTHPHKLKERVLAELSEKGSRRWNDLWNLKLTKSRSRLAQCLEQLVAEGKIRKVKISHKNAKYILTEDFKTFREAQTLDKKLESSMKDFLKEISESPIYLKPEQLKAWFTSILLHYLGNFLHAMEYVVRAPQKFQGYARTWLLERFIDRFGRTLAVCGHTDQNATDLAIRIIKLYIGKILDDMKNISGTYPIKGAEKTSFIDFDIKQVVHELEVLRRLSQKKEI